MIVYTLILASLALVDIAMMLRRKIWWFGPSTQEQHNMTKSTIHRLPNELILIIVQQYLSETDALSIRASCRCFLYLRSPDPLAVGRESRNAFARLYRHDQLAHLCQLEQAGVLVGVCSYCRTTHPQRRFSAEELLRAPEQRRCIGATAPVPLCRHLNVCNAQLVGSMGWPLYHCKVCSATASTSGRSYVILRRIYFRLEVPRRETLDRETLAAAIVGLTPSPEQICPHLSTKSVAVRFPACWLKTNGDRRLCVGPTKCNKKYCYGVVACVACSYSVHAELERTACPGRLDVDIVTFQVMRLIDLETISGAVPKAWLELCGLK